MRRCTFLLWTSALCLFAKLDGGCPVHTLAQRSPPHPIQAYADLSDAVDKEEWHSSTYWPISSTELGEGIEDLNAWLERCTAALPVFLPYTDPKVEVIEAFVGSHDKEGTAAHSAIDYARPDRKSFTVHAVADGQVIWKGYHPSTGHVLILEHRPAEGPVFRSVYQHLRNGRTTDIKLARQTRRLLEGASPELWDSYAKEYQDIGDRAQAQIDGLLPRNEPWLLSTFGTDEQVIPVEVGAQVQAGQVIAWAGNTGCHSHGTHLHFRVAREATFVRAGEYYIGGRMGIRRWTCFDPYGLYGGPNDLDAYHHDDKRRTPYQHPALFAPCPLTFVQLDQKRFEEAQKYYESVHYFPRVLQAEYVGKRYTKHLPPGLRKTEHAFAYTGQFEYDSNPPRLLLLKKTADLQESLEKWQLRSWYPTAVATTFPTVDQMRFTAVLDRKAPEKFQWEALLKPEDFYQKVDEMFQQGYLLATFNPYRQYRETYINALWTESGEQNDHRVAIHLTEEGLLDKTKTLERQGYNLAEVTAYPEVDGTRYAALWHHQSLLGPTHLIVDIPRSLLDNTIWTERYQGHRLRHMSSNNDRYSLLFETGALQEQRSSVPVASYIGPQPPHYTPIHGEALPGSYVEKWKVAAGSDPVGTRPFPLESPNYLLVEAESLVTSSTPSQGTIKAEYTHALQGLWSNHMHAFWVGAIPEATCDIPLHIPFGGKFEILLTPSLGPGYGLFQVFLNGRTIGSPINEYRSLHSPGPRLSLGFHELQKGFNQVQIKVLSKDPLSKSFDVAIDKFELIPIGNR